MLKNMKVSTILWTTVVIYGIIQTTQAMPASLPEQGPSLSNNLQELLYLYEGPFGFRNSAVARGPLLRALPGNPSFESEEQDTQIERIPRVFPKPHSGARDSPDLPEMTSSWNSPKAEDKRTRLSVGLSLETLSSMLSNSNQQRDRERLAAMIKQRLMNAGR